jgi:hypothetical protein
MKIGIFHAGRAVLIVLANLAFLSRSVTVMGAIIYSEPFNYGSSNTMLSGLNGGTGFGSEWVQQNPGIIYVYPGLSLSDLPVSGGAAYATGTDGIGSALLYRSLNNQLNGIYYGMFLTCAVQSNFNTVNEVMCGIGLGSGMLDPHGNNYAIDAPFDNYCLSFFGGYNASSSNELNEGETYLVLFKVNTTTQVASGWVLSSDQYDYFKVNGLTEASLNSAGIGVTANQVWGMASGTNGVKNPTIIVTELSIYLSAPGGVTATLLIDELRLSDMSLSEAVFGDKPTLQIAFNGTVALLSWNTNFSGFSLQQATAANSTNWTTLQGSPSIIDDTYVYPVEMTNTTFFRLESN